MDPLQRYQNALQNGSLREDDAQAAVVDQLQLVYQQLTAWRKRPFWQAWFNKSPIKGLYLHGDVGIGKTCLMDMFYACLPPERKIRIHFHRFMRQIHQQLRELQGTRNPLCTVAKRLRERSDIICFDEFFVADIVDAMLLGNLLSELFAQGLVLIATSNAAPDDLYKHGLQRDRFLPAIALIKQYCTVLAVASTHDYRLQTHEQAGTYYLGFAESARAQFKQHFISVAGAHIVWHKPLNLESRSLHAQAYSHDAVWFKFVDVINIPHSQRDYLELAQCFHTVFLSDVPQMGMQDNDLICNFIKFIDILYDAHVKLIIQAIAPIDELYISGRMLESFKRTKSRLIEMQSREYLCKAHGLRPVATHEQLLELDNEELCQATTQQKPSKS